MTPQPLYIASCSFGKDSVATILLALENKEPLDRVVFMEVMFDHSRNISGEDPDLWAKLRKFNEIPNKVSEKFNKRYTFNELEARLDRQDKIDAFNEKHKQQTLF